MFSSKQSPRVRRSLIAQQVFPYFLLFEQIFVLRKIEII